MLFRPADALSMHVDILRSLVLIVELHKMCDFRTGLGSSLFVRRDVVLPAFIFLFRDDTFVAHFLIVSELCLGAAVLPCIVLDGIVQHQIMPIGNFLATQE